jgi:hypothetical protein
MNTDLEKLIDELSFRLKHGKDVSLWQNSSHLAPIVNILHKLTTFPKTRIPAPDLTRVKNQVFDKISIPAEVQTEVRSDKKNFWANLPSMIRLTSTAVGTLLILISLGIGTAVAALQSVPGQTLYPLKKVVENIQLRLTSDPSAKTNLQIQFANNRLEELTSVIEKNKAGELSSEKAQAIVSQTVAALEKTTAALSTTSAKESSKTTVATLAKLVDLSNKQTAVLKPLLSAATISNEGQIKTVLEQALQTSKTSKEEAIRNIENAGLKIEDQPITLSLDNQIEATGDITAITADTVSIGTAKFLMTKDTEYANIKSTDLKLGLKIKILGEVHSDKKTYAITISPVEKSTSDTNTDNKTPIENSNNGAPR